jgi:hypothetical protein
LASAGFANNAGHRILDCMDGPAQGITVNERAFNGFCGGASLIKAQYPGTRSISFRDGPQDMMNLYREWRAISFQTDHARPLRYRDHSSRARRITVCMVRPSAHHLQQVKRLECYNGEY